MSTIKAPGYRFPNVRDSNPLKEEFTPFALIKEMVPEKDGDAFCN